MWMQICYLLNTCIGYDCRAVISDFQLHQSAATDIGDEPLIYYRLFLNEIFNQHFPAASNNHLLLENLLVCGLPIQPSL